MREAISLEISFIYYRVSGRRDLRQFVSFGLDPFALTIQYSECLLLIRGRMRWQMDEAL